MPVWNRLPSDLVRLILSFTSTPKTVYHASLVCQHWNLAIDHPATWLSLCESSQWNVPSTLHRSLIREFFIHRYRTIRRYERGYWSRRAWQGHAAGIVALATPPSKRFYSWSAAESQSVDEGLLISAASAPTYGLKIWKLDSNSTGVDCLNEQHVYSNPLIADTDGAPLPRARCQWSCVDVVTDSLSQSQEQAQIWAVNNKMAGSAYGSAASASASSASLHPPALSSNFLVFAVNDPHSPPLLYLHDCHSKRLRTFKAGHSSAICCVKVLRPPVLNESPWSSSISSSSKVAGFLSQPATRRLAVSGGYDHAACVWDINSGGLVARLRGGCASTVWCVDIHPSGRLVAMGADDRTIRIFKLNAHQRNDDEEDVDSEDEEYMLSLTPQQQAKHRRERKLRVIRELLQKKEERAQELRAEEERPSRYKNDARFNGPPEDPNQVASNPAASSEAAPATSSPEATPSADEGGKLMCTLVGHNNTPMTVQFDPYSPSTRLWSAGYDKSIRLWDISDLHNPRLVREFVGHTAVVFSIIVTPHVLISSSRDGTVRIWDRDSGKLLRRLDAQRSNSDLVSEIQSQNSSSEEKGSLASSRASAFDLKCALRTALGDIVIASSDGKIAYFEFERFGDGSSRPHSSSPNALRRANSNGNSTGNGSATNQQPDACAIM